jgi:arsenate reductase
MRATIYHNARCSKSRATLALLQGRNVDVKVINYLESPPAAEELSAVLERLGRTPVALIRFGEPVAGELGIKPSDVRADDEWIDIMAAHPILIERPIVVVGDRAAIGRPPENVLALFG